MRKIYYLLFIFILTGCSKNSGLNPTNNSNSAIITYSFKASVSGKYSIVYEGPHNLGGTPIQVTGNSWSKTDTISNVSSYPNGYGFPLVLGSDILVSGVTCTLTISVNNKVESTGNFSYPFGEVSYNYVILH